MTVTPPLADFSTVALLQSAKAKADAYRLARESLELWCRVQYGLVRASEAARRAVVTEGRTDDVAADILRNNGTTLSEQLATYTGSASKAAIDAALGTLIGLTQAEIDAAVAYLSHGCQQLTNTPADGSDYPAICDMIDASYTAPQEI